MRSGEAPGALRGLLGKVSISFMGGGYQGVGILGNWKVAVRGGWGRLRCASLGITDTARGAQQEANAVKEPDTKMNLIATPYKTPIPLYQ